jgi:hypothetical protein
MPICYECKKEISELYVLVKQTISSFLSGVKLKKDVIGGFVLDYESSVRDSIKVHNSEFKVACCPSCGKELFKHESDAIKFLMGQGVDDTKRQKTFDEIIAELRQDVKFKLIERKNDRVIFEDEYDLRYELVISDYGTQTIEGSSSGDLSEKFKEKFGDGKNDAYMQYQWSMLDRLRKMLDRFKNNKG